MKDTTMLIEYFGLGQQAAPPEHVEYYARKNKEAKELAISSQRFVIVEYGGLDALAGISQGYGLVYSPFGVSFTIGHYDEATTQAAISLITLANEAKQEQDDDRRTNQADRKTPVVGHARGKSLDRQL